MAEVLWPWFLQHALPPLVDITRVAQALDQIALEHRLALGSREGHDIRLRNLRVLAWRDRDLYLRLIDWGLFQRQAGADELAAMLERAGSVWTVAPDKRGLSRRVLPAAQDAVELVVSAKDKAAELIGTAWRAIYGREPNPTDGFNRAVKAVEAVACPVIVPDDKGATLGRAIGELRANKTRVATVFRSPRGTDPVDAVLAMMQLVWTNNYARHAADPSVPLDVTQAEAEAALHVAVTLVHWFQRGFVVAAGGA